MKLSIIIPIYNEKKYICEVIDRIIKADIGHVAKEIIIVDDYSTDGTREILKNEIEPLVDRVIYKARNSSYCSITHFRCSVLQLRLLNWFRPICA